MSIYLDEMDTYTRLDEWIDLNSRHGNTKLIEQAFNAYADLTGAMQFSLESFVVIPVHGYLAVAHIIGTVIGEYHPIEISSVVKPFDEDRTFPLQRIKKEITWD